MPKATISLDAQKHDLKSLKGGFVSLRPLPYGKILERRDGATKMIMEQTKGRTADSRMIMEMAQEWSRWFEFRECIVEHNLEDDAGATLDFNIKANLFRLDPKIGQEIERLIDELNMDVEEAEQLETFTKSLSGSSLAEVPPKEATLTKPTT